MRLQLGLGVLVNLYRAPGFVGGIADILQDTVDAFRFAGDAEFASCQMSWWAKRIHFSRGMMSINLVRFSADHVRGEFEAAGDAVHVGIDNDAFGDFDHEPRTTFAVLRATPGRVRRSFMLSGT